MTTISINAKNLFNRTRAAKAASVRDFFKTVAPRYNTMMCGSVADVPLSFTTWMGCEIKYGGNAVTEPHVTLDVENLNPEFDTAIELYKEIRDECRHEFDGGTLLMEFSNRGLCSVREKFIKGKQRAVELNGRLVYRDYAFLVSIVKNGTYILKA